MKKVLFILLYIVVFSLLLPTDLPANNISGTKIGFNILKDINLCDQFTGARSVKLLIDRDGKYYLIGDYIGGTINIYPLNDSLKSLILSKIDIDKIIKKRSINQESRVPFIIYEFLTGEVYSSLMLLTYDRYNIMNDYMAIITYPVMTAAGIILPTIYTSNNEITYGECIQSANFSLHMGGMGFAVNYVITEEVEPLTILLSSATGNIGGYIFAKQKAYTGGQSLLYGEILQKTSYISISASTAFQDSVNSRIVAGSYVGVTAIGIGVSYYLAEKFSDISIGDVIAMDGLSNAFSGVSIMVASSFTHEPKIIFPISYVMLTPGYYLSYKLMEKGHIGPGDGILFNLGIYAGAILGVAVDGVIAISTNNSSMGRYEKFWGTAIGTSLGTYIMYRWLENRIEKNVDESKFDIYINPIPIVSIDDKGKYSFSMNNLFTVRF
ncbi:hypothetical protein KAU43_07035 [candidate division WOR-3 bacterium]|nr:hypothetical protein [candidate division WOR-3 bacterium]